MRAAAAILVVVVLAAALAFWAAVGTPPNAPGHAVTVVVREGDGIADIARRLENAGVVRSGLAFRLWARMRGRDRALHPGRYRFDGPASLDGVLQILASAPALRDLTIPEGRTVREIASLLETAGLGTASEVLCLATDPDFLMAAGVPGAQLEGYPSPTRTGSIRRRAWRRSSKSWCGAFTSASTPTVIAAQPRAA
jgi:UPF0755 protein